MCATPNLLGFFGLLLKNASSRDKQVLALFDSFQALGPSNSLLS